MNAAPQRRRGAGMGGMRPRVIIEFVASTLIILVISVVIWFVAGNELTAEQDITIPLDVELPPDLASRFIVIEPPQSPLKVRFQGPSDIVQVLAQRQHRVRAVWSVPAAALTDADGTIRLTVELDELQFEYVDEGPIPSAIKPLIATAPDTGDNGEADGGGVTEVIGTAAAPAAEPANLSLTLALAHVVELPVNRNHLVAAFSDLPPDRRLRVEDYEIGSGGSVNVYFRGPANLEPFPTSPEFEPTSLERFADLASERPQSVPLEFKLPDPKTCGYFEDAACTRRIERVRVTFGFDDITTATVAGVRLPLRVVLPSRYIARGVTVGRISGFEETFVANVSLAGPKDQIAALQALIEQRPNDVETLLYLALVVHDEGDEKLAEFRRLSVIHTAAVHFELGYRKPPPGLPNLTGLDLAAIEGRANFNDLNINLYRGRPE